MNIHTALAMLVPDQGITAQISNPEQCREMVAAARDHLKDAYMARDAAAIVVTEAEASVERVQQLIRAADDATAELAEAQENSAAFSKHWAESGAPTGAPRVDPKLQALADAAARKATDAKIAADGASDGLPAAWAALRDAQEALHRAEENIGAADTAVLVATLEEHFVMALKNAAGFDVHSGVIQACARALAGNHYDFSDDSMAARVLSRLRAITPAAPPQNASELKKYANLTERYKEFVELGTRLLKDADAE